jgi:hypothetical protein
MPRRTTLAAVASACLLGACASAPTLLESDIPLPEGMRTLRSADIRRAGGEVVGGRFLLAGAVDDARDTVNAAVARFTEKGWSVASTTLGLDHSAASFMKGARRVDLVVDRRALEPAMSTGCIEVRTGDAPVPRATTAP